MGESPSAEGTPVPGVERVGPALLDAVADGIYRLDSDDRFVDVSDSLTDLTGYPREALVGSHVSTLLDAEDTVRAETAIRDRLLENSRDSVRLTLPLFTASGEAVPCEIHVGAVVRDGEFRGSVGLVRAIEDEAVAARVRDASERRQAFDALAAASADGIIMLDDASIIRYANPAVERILGYAPEELVDASKMKIIPERLRKTHAEALERYLDTGEKHIDWTYVELPGLHRDGHEVSLAISLNEFEHDGEHYFVGTFRDISKRKEVEWELERQNERLEQFASMLAHELRNPLQIAQLYLDFLADGDAESVDRIAESLDRIDEIIEVLLVLARSRDEVGEREIVELADAATRAWNGIDAEAAELEIVSEQALRTNPTSLQHLLVNLFRNAIEHGGDGVTVRVGALEGGFYVEDDGPGIPEGKREDVVEAGYTADAGGIGLGLTFVDQLTDAYEWEYAIAESDAGGARFEFTGVETERGE